MRALILLLALALVGCGQRETAPPEGEPPFLQAAAAYSKETSGLAVLVLERGEITLEEYQNGQTADQAVGLVSGTKSFWGVAAAAAVADGLLSFDEAAADTLTEWRSDPLRSRITVRHLLSLTSGLEPVDLRVVEAGATDLFGFAVASPAAHEPGSHFEYDSVHLQAFGELLKRKLGGEDPVAYLQRRVLDPIGVKVADWERDSAGNPGMAAGAWMTARDWATFGQFLLQEGEWEGQQIIPAALLRECFVGTKANLAYGLTFWINPPADKADPLGPPDLIRLSGYGGQRLYIIPSWQMVVVRLGFEPEPGWSRPPTFEDQDFLNLLQGKFRM